MDVSGRVVVVTGGGHGIGRALCRRFAAEGAAGVVVADVDGDAAAVVAGEIGGRAVTCDVSSGPAVDALVAEPGSVFGPVDLFCSNAGLGDATGVFDPASEWRRMWDVNVMAHVHAARAVLPSMLERGQGWLLQTASAAGLLNHPTSAAYAVTKRGVVGFAEWLAITYGARGIGVSVLAPLGVRTDMLDASGPAAEMLRQGAVDPEQVADAVIEGLAAERFLILPQPEVQVHMGRKADDVDRWLAGMRRLRAQIDPA